MRDNTNRRNNDSDTRKEKNIINVVFDGILYPPRPLPGEAYAITQTTGRDNEITFTYADLEDINPNHNEALVVSLNILEVKKVLIDNGSSVDIMFMHF